MKKAAVLIVLFFLTLLMSGSFVGIRKKGPFIHLKMNDTSGTTVTDSSGNNYNGTAQRDCSYLTTAGRINTALSCNGSTDYINCGKDFWSEFLSDGFSYSFWVKFDSQADPLKFTGIIQGPVLIECSSIGDEEGELYFLLGPLYNEIGELQVCGFILDKWHYIALTVEQVDSDTINMTYYYNAIYIKNAEISGSLLTDLGESFDLIIGWTPGKFINCPVDGAFDDFRIYDRVLTPSEMSIIFNGFSGTEE